MKGSKSWVYVCGLGGLRVVARVAGLPERARVKIRRTESHVRQCETVHVVRMARYHANLSAILHMNDLIIQSTVRLLSNMVDNAFC